MGCTESETSDTCRLFPEPVARFRKEATLKGLCAVLREPSVCHRDGKRAPENRRLALRLETVPCTQAQRDLREWLSHPDSKR
jgi:hypothetical protein